MTGITEDIDQTPESVLIPDSFETRSQMIYQRMLGSEVHSRELSSFIVSFKEREGDLEEELRNHMLEYLETEAGDAMLTLKDLPIVRQYITYAYYGMADSICDQCGVELHIFNETGFHLCRDCNDIMKDEERESPF